MTSPIPGTRLVVFLLVLFTTACSKSGTDATTEAGAASVLFSGNLVNCKNSPVQSGYVRILLDGNLHKASISNGVFETRIPRSSNALATATLAWVDEGSISESHPVTLPVSKGSYTGIQIDACNSTNMQYISYTLNGTNYLHQAPADSLIQAPTSVDDKTTILCYKGDDLSKEAVSFTFNGETKPGNYPVSSLSIRQEKLQFTPSEVIAVAITDYGSPGGYIVGTASGKLRDSAGKIIPFSIRFKVIRKY